VADLAILNGSVIAPSLAGVNADPLPNNVIIDQGRITALVTPGERIEADKIIDADGMLVLPGAIDIHFHCRAPAFPERGDFFSESRAAAAGGVTTFFEMPISNPCASTTEVWRNRCELALQNVLVNVGLFAAPGRLDRNEIDGMVEAGAIGFKVFMTAAVKGRESEFDGLCITELANIAQALELIQETGLRCVFHAEDQGLIDLYMERARRSELPDYLRHRRSRPAVAEATAVAGLLSLAKSIGTPIHIAHVSSAASVELIRRARDEGLPVSAETCPHYLLFDEEVLERVGPYGKINPPIRGPEDREALWQAVDEGVIDVIATDHAPFTSAEKEASWGNIIDAPPGHPGVEMLVPLVLDQALRGRISLAKAVELISTKPAQLFGLYPQKGSLWPGADADITLFDPRPEREIRLEDGFSRAAACNWLYRGMRLQGTVAATIVGGKIVYQDGQIVGNRGDGHLARPIKH
jgi:allantoinase